ncbi:MAG: hypothetical protein IJO61_01635 [Oscillospiraceae bacterium]|nr:hypothetical protein [Oscillospiraceae bacterium]
MVLKRTLTIFVLVSILVTLFYGCGTEGADSPEAAVENYLNAYLEADSESITKTLPPQIAEPFAIISKGKTDSINESIKSSLADEENSYEITGKEKMTDEEKARYEKRLSSSASDYAKAAKLESLNTEIKIEEAYNVSATLKNGGNRSKTSFPVGKIDGKWYILRDNPIA